MFKLRSGHIKNYMIVLITIFIVVSLLTTIYFFSAIDNISIESDLYQRIKASKDLKADILPPKLYIVESYLIVQQIVNEREDGKIDVLLKNMETTRGDYLLYYNRWQNNIDDDSVIDLLILSDIYVSEFYHIYDEDFTPALDHNDYQRMQEIANNEMKPVFEKHRGIINLMTDILEASNIRVESDAKDFADQSRIILLCVYLISFLIILIISIIIFRKVADIEKKIISSRHETEIANERLNTMVDGLKIFKHGYENTLASIKGFMYREDYKGLKNYLDEIIAEKNKNEMVNYFKLDFIKNPAVTGLIIAKMIYADDQGVEFILKVRSDIKNVPIKLNHLCEILGILLDNAIEAAAESDEKKVYFKIEESKEAYNFEIKNSIKTAPNRIKMFEKSWTTKGENRGFGLWIAKEVVKEYDNILLNTIVDEKVVGQDLLIFKEAVDDEEATLFTDIL